MSPFIFLIFCNQLEFHKAQRVPLLQFWALDIAPTLAVPGLLLLIIEVDRCCILRQKYFFAPQVPVFFKQESQTKNSFPKAGKGTYHTWPEL